MKGLMIGVSGVRGRVDREFNPRLISTLSHAFGRFIGGGRVVIGRDTRPSGEMCRHALLSGLLYTGCDVVDLGICPTPTVLLMVRQLKANGGIAITASHNPIEWNAFKFVGSDGSFLDREAMERFLAEVREVTEGVHTEMSHGSLSHFSEGIERHIESILGLDLIDVEKIRERKYRVAVDCCNGAGSAMTPGLLAHLGCEVLPIFCELDGAFPRNPEPVAENLGKLAEFVEENHADVGMAHDPDADRLSLVDETGRPLGEEMTLALAVRFVLGKRPGPVAANLSTSMMIDDVSKEFGVEVHRTSVGEINVSRCLQETGGVIGGEGNGGVILPELQFTRDAPMGVALILQYMTDTGKKLSALVSEIPAYVMVKERMELTGDEDVDFNAIKEAHSEATIDEVDGLKLMWEREWVHIRKSGTEPIVRIIVEAVDRERAVKLVNEIKGMISERE
jgi:phosphomannomutase